MGNTKYDKLEIDGLAYKTTFTSKFQNRKKWAKPDPGAVYNFIPGTIINMYVEAGDDVKAGDVLCILEAMKMRNKVLAPIDGKVEEVNVKTGDKLRKDTLMFSIR